MDIYICWKKECYYKNKRWNTNFHVCNLYNQIVYNVERNLNMGFFEKLKQGLEKTKDSFNNIFSGFRKVDESLLEELEEALIMSDVGMDTALDIISKLRERIKKEKIEDEEQVKLALREEIEKILEVEGKELNLKTKPSVILVVGVNGVR